jgi:hypothetical protein
VYLANEKSLTTSNTLKGELYFNYAPITQTNNYFCRYVEMLESQQAQLVNGLQEMYKMTQNGEGWRGPALKESQHGHPLTHDILERLGALKHSSSGESEAFEEDFHILQRRLIDSGAGYMQRASSSDTDSLHSPDTPTFFHSQQSPNMGALGQIYRGSAPPTPPMQSKLYSNAQSMPQSSQNIQTQFANVHRQSSPAMNPIQLNQLPSWNFQVPMNSSPVAMSAQDREYINGAQKDSYPVFPFPIGGSPFLDAPDFDFESYLNVNGA